MPRRPLRWAHATLSVLDPLPVSLPILKPGLFVAFSVFLHVGTDFSFLPRQPCFRARVQQVVCCLFIASLPARTVYTEQRTRHAEQQPQKNVPQGGPDTPGRSCRPRALLLGLPKDTASRAAPSGLDTGHGRPTSVAGLSARRSVRASWGGSHTPLNPPPPSWQETAVGSSSCGQLSPVGSSVLWAGESRAGTPSARPGLGRRGQQRERGRPCGEQPCPSTRRSLLLSKLK